MQCNIFHGNTKILRIIYNLDRILGFFHVVRPCREGVQKMKIPKIACWTGISFFSLIGPYSVFSAYQKLGSSWALLSLKAILDDPIYLYAALDLLAIFSIISYWTYFECKKRGIWFWPWPVLFFIFGTPAYLLFKLYLEKKGTTSSQEACELLCRD